MEGSEKWSTTGISFDTDKVFSIYIIDTTEGVNSYLGLFADDEILLRKVINHKDCEEM